MGQIGRFETGPMGKPITDPTQPILQPRNKTQPNLKQKSTQTGEVGSVQLVWVGC